MLKQLQDDLNMFFYALAGRTELKPQYFLAFVLVALVGGGLGIAYLLVLQ